jgi:hypothetical protein
MEFNQGEWVQVVDEQLRLTIIQLLESHQFTQTNYHHNSMGHIKYWNV